MKPTLAKSPKPIATQAPAVIEQPLPARRRGCRPWRPVDTLLLIGVVLSLAILSVTVVWSLRPHLKGYDQAKCVVVDVQPVQPRHCNKLPQCYPGRHFYNDDKTGWCEAIEDDEKPDEEEDRRNDENQRQERWTSHEYPDDEDDDDDTSRPRGLRHELRHEQGPRRRSNGPHQSNSREETNDEDPESLTTTAAPGALGRHRQPAPCVLVTVEVSRRHSNTWGAVLYSARTAAHTCSECSYRACVDETKPREGELLSCYYRHEDPERVFGGHLDGQWSGRRRVVCPVVFAAVFLLLLVLRRLYLCCIVPGHQVGYTDGIVYAVPSAKDKSENTTSARELSRDTALEVSAPPQYSEVVANERPPGYDEILKREPKNELVLTPIAQS